MRNFSKGQISIFLIIAGVLIVLAIGTFTLSKSEIVIFEDEKSSYKVKEYVIECLDSQTKEGLKRIGEYGGWLYHPYPDVLFADQNTIKPLIKQSQGISFLGKQNILYWHYYDDASQTFKTRIPEFDSENQYSLKNQLKTYLENNLEKKCIQGFKSFEDVYEIEYMPQEMQITVIDFKENEEEFKVRLFMPVNIEEKGTENKEYFEKYEVKKDNILQVPYFIAKDIVEAQRNNSFIEHRSIHFITPYMSSKTRDLLPPFYDFKNKFDFNPWKVEEVSDLTQRILASNMQEMKFLGTAVNRNEVPKNLRGNEFAEAMANIYVDDYLTQTSITKEQQPKVFEKYDNYKIDPTYIYQIFPMYFSIKNSMGDIVLLPKPQSFLGGILPFFFTEYSATYEMTYPVMFKIQEDKPNNKFEFNLMIEANIAHNTPLAENYELNVNNNLELLNSAQTLACDPPQFISKPVYLNITDRVNFGKRKDLFNDPVVGVQDAIVTFNCGGISQCYVGNTKINGESKYNNITRLGFRLPIDCDPGTIEVYKYGHRKVIIDNVNPSLTNELHLGEFFMDSKKPLKLEIIKKKQSGARSSVREIIQETETGFLIFTNLDDENDVSVVEINSTNQFDLELELMPGNFSINGYILDEKENLINVPSSKVCYKKGLFSGKECVDVPGFTADSWVRSGIDISRFEVKYADLVLSENIIVEFVDFELPKTYDELRSSSEYMGQLEGFSKKPSLN